MTEEKENVFFVLEKEKEKRRRKKELRSEARSNENCQLLGQIDWSVYFY